MGKHKDGDHGHGMKGWVDLGSDVNWAAYGGMWGRRVVNPLTRQPTWFIVRVQDLWETTGMLEGPRIEGDLLMVRLHEIPPDMVERALQYVGWSSEIQKVREDEILTERLKVEACVHFGLHAILETRKSHGHAARVRAAMRRQAEYYALAVNSFVEGGPDPLIEQELEEVLDQPCNGIGTTKLEMMKGDVLGGLNRRALNDEQKNRIKDLVMKLSKPFEPEDIAKMKEWEELQKSDPFVFAFGFMEGIANRPFINHEEGGGEVTKAYKAGFEWAALYKRGRLPSPAGIKLGPSQHTAEVHISPKEEGNG